MPFRPTPLGPIPNLANSHLGQCHLGQDPLWPMPFRQIAISANAILANAISANSHFGQFSLVSMRIAGMHNCIILTSCQICYLIRKCLKLPDWSDTTMNSAACRTPPQMFCVVKPYFSQLLNPPVLAGGHFEVFYFSNEFVPIPSKFQKSTFWTIR